MKRTTLKDVADRAGVSKATVSYILNNSKKTISQETREKVQKAMKELNYIPDLGAASLTSKCSKLIGVVIPQTEPGSRLMFQNGFYSEILGAIEYRARLNGYHIIISATDVNESYIKLVVERNLDGVIAIGVYPDDFYEQFKTMGVPIVLIDSYCPDIYFKNIRIDDELGGYLSTKYMIDKGHRKIGILSGIQHENGVVKKRIQGYKKALNENNIEVDPGLIFEGEVDYQNGIDSARRIVEEKTDITGLVTTADILAIGALKGFSSMGAKVPEDYSVIGFDDLEISKYLTPGLTTIKQDITKKGEMAVELLSRSMESNDFESEDIIMPLEIVERGSVKQIIL